MRKDVMKSLIAMRQCEIPFDVKERDMSLPVDRGKIITVPGVRRCGKSKMMELTINHLVGDRGVDPKRILWMGFDDERLIGMAATELDDVLAAYMEMYPGIAIKDVYMFFDEIQLIAGWEFFVLRVYKNYCKNIYVCGSNATMLSTNLTSALRGYPLEYEIYPLSFREYCRFTGVNADGYTEQDRASVRRAFDDYNGGSAFPEVVLTSSPSERLKMLHAYFDVMLLKDLAEHYKIANTVVVRYFVKRLMANLTKPTSINAIYNDIKSQGLRVSKDDLYLWAGYLCDIFLFIKMPRYDRSLIRGQHAFDKYYCIDNGLRSAVLMPQSSDNGKMLENTVFMQLHRCRQPFDKITYFRGSGECDFVVQRGERVEQLIQSVWDMNDVDTCKREIAGLLEASDATGCTNLLIVTHDEEDVIEHNGHTITIVPAARWLLRG